MSILGKIFGRGGSDDDAAPAAAAPAEPTPAEPAPAEPATAEPATAAPAAGAAEGVGGTVIRSPFPDVDIPNVSVYDFLFGTMKDEDLGKAAFIDGASGNVTTYNALIGQVNGVAGALAARGLEVGDVVGLHSPNVPAFGAVFHGVLRAGGTATTINALYTAEDIAKQLTDSKTWF